MNEEEDRPRPTAQRIAGPSAEAARPERGLDIGVQDAIGRSLQAHYDDLVRAPVPDRLLVLLAELEAKETSRGR